MTILRPASAGLRFFLLLLGALCVALAPALRAEFDDASGLFGDEPEFLKADEAFVLTTQLADDGTLLVHWDMPDGYYLYRHRFDFETRDGSPVTVGEAAIDPGKKKVDDYFGEVEVYYHVAEARVPVSGSGSAEVGISYQGCADAGLCYPPQTKWVPVSLAAASPPSGAATAPAGPPSTGAGPNGGLSGGQTEEQTLAGLLNSASLLTALAIFFVAGVGLAFTPCVLPMVPILSSIIVGESKDLSRGRAFTLSLAYVLGMAVTYAALGVLMGLFGASLNLQAALQSPPVLIVFSLVFVALAFAMFGFYELRLPNALQDRLNALSDKQSGGKLLSVALMGSLSSLVVSPCVSAPLAGALIYISTTGDAMLGGGVLLALGLGMGTPLLLIGASGGHLLPRAGAWMNTVKAVFGVLLLGVAVCCWSGWYRRR